MNTVMINMETQFELWSKKLRQTMAALSEDEVKGCLEEIKILEEKYGAAQEILRELKETKTKESKRLRTQTWIAWNELEDAFLDFEQSLKERRNRK